METSSGKKSRPGVPAPRIEDLIPIAVVITAGCEPCARRMVRRALEQGSPAHHVRKVLGIVEAMRGEDCLARAVGPEVLARADKPLAMARRTLAEATCVEQGAG